MKSKTLSWQIHADRNKLIDSLANGQVSLVTTDTVVGLLAPVTPQGQKQLNLIKERSDKPYLILIHSPDMVSEFIDQNLSNSSQKLIAAWPGPLTLIFKAKPKYSSLACSVDGTVALRVPNLEGLRDVLKHFDGLFSTSANRAGTPYPQDMGQVELSIKNAVAFMVIDPEQERSIPSTILDCSGPEIKVVREGAYPLAVIEQIVGKKFS